MTRLLFGGAWDRWRTSIIPVLPPTGTIIDLGCGTGALVHRLNTLGYVAFGLDREPSMLRRARSLPTSRSRLVRGDAGALPFRDSVFDACVATFPARYILQPATLDEVARVVRPGGALVIVLSGYTEDWPLRRLPIRLALRIFYGRRDTEQAPPPDLIAHPALLGEWCWRTNGPDHVLAWIGVRSDASKSAG
ncbi:MAG TPA: methyltransferase domain-containing protein [Nitrolancea sp.]|nr:methyltransferase domain-containing protein [Nitrolancea sp.]